MKFNKDIIQRLCVSEERIPKEYRESKQLLVDFVNYIKEENFLITNPYVMTVISMVENINNNYSIVQKIEYIGKQPTYDLEIENVHSYKANGIIAHNTVNLPNNVTEEEVSTIYMKAWEDNLKGITVYRDGCRAGVMVSTDNKKENDKKENPLAAKRRPKSLPCKVIRFTNKGEKWIGVVGILDGQPYEIFTGLQENLSIPNWVTDGEIVRNKEDGHSRYDICYLDKEGYKVCIQGLSRISNPEYWNYGKLISGLLRHHMEIQYIIKVISSLKLDDSINAWKNGIIRTLQKFEDNHTEVQGEKCPECGGTLIREGGCIHCKDCGWTRCE